MFAMIDARVDYEFCAFNLIEEIITWLPGLYFVGYF